MAEDPRQLPSFELEANGLFFGSAQHRASLERAGRFENSNPQIALIPEFGLLPTPDKSSSDEQEIRYSARFLLGTAK